jgi:hypothetical protein
MTSISSKLDLNTVYVYVEDLQRKDSTEKNIRRQADQADLWLGGKRTKL